MSVRGEFVRIVGDAIDRLREIDTDPARDLARELEQAREGASQDLSGAADRALALWHARASLGAADDRLEDAGERLLAVSRVILGR